VNYGSRLKAVADAIAAYRPECEVGLVEDEYGQPWFVARAKDKRWPKPAKEIVEETFAKLVDSKGLRDALCVLRDMEVELKESLKKDIIQLENILESDVV